MHTRAKMTALTLSLIAGASASVALGQVVPKIPPAPEPTPAYVPPAPAPAPEPTKAPEPEPAISLIEKDSAGKLKMITSSIEDAALKIFPFDAARRAKVDASLAARDADIERFVVDHLSEIKSALAARAALDNVTDFNALNTAREAAKPLKQENVLDRLMRDSAIGAPQRARLDQAVTEYTEARKKEQSEAIGADVMKIATVVGQQGFNDLTRDTLAGFDRLSERAAASLRAGDHGLALEDSQNAALKTLLTTIGGDKEMSGRAGLRTFLLDTLTPEQAKTLLGRFVTPAAK
jgi:hypothetical protein